MSNAIKPDDLGKAVKAFLDDFKDATMVDLEEATKTTAQQTVDFLKDKAVRQNWGKYGNSFTYSNKKGTASFTGKVVHCKAPFYRLTHLLEYGHLTRNNTTRSARFPHWQPAEDYASKKYPDNLRKEMNR